MFGLEQIISKNLHTGITKVLKKPTGTIYIQDVQAINEHTLSIYLRNGAKGIVSIDTLELINKETNDYDFGRLASNILRLILRKISG